MKPLPKLLSVGVIAEELGVPVDRVSRVLRSRPHIKPKALVGNVRVYDEDALAMIRYAINAIDARKGARHV